MPVTYKQLGWTMKFEGDAVKVPDVKGSLPVAGSYDITVPIAKHDPCNPKAVATVDFADTPAGLPIVLVVVKLDPAGAGGLVKPLKLQLFDKDHKPHGGARYLTPDAGKSGLVYSIVVRGFAPPYDNASTLQVENENASDLSLQVQVAYGPKPQKDGKPAAAA